MKKLIFGLVAVLILFGAVITFNQQPASKPVQSTQASNADAVSAPAAESAPAETPAPPEVHTLDYEAIRDLHPADDAAVTVEGESVNWGDYAGWIRTNGLQYEDYFRQMGAYYGVAADWKGSMGDGSGMTYAEGLLSETNDTIGSFLAIRAFAKEKGVELDAETLAEISPEHLAVDICDEGATVEDLAKKLEETSHMTVDNYRFYSETILLYAQLFKELYGEAGEKLTEEEVIDALEAKGYLSAAHILFMTIDPMTGKELDAETIAKKREQAEAVVKELRAIEDPEKLVKRFAELKEQYCEDTGKEIYPDGYTFTPGTMVQEFESAIKAMGDYEVSEPVQTSYGLHVIMRLPLSADSLLSTATGTPLEARRSVAQESITEQLDAYFEAHPATYIEGLEELDLTKYIVE